MADTKPARIRLRSLHPWFPESAPDNAMRSPRSLSEVELRDLMDAAWQLSRAYRNGYLRGTSLEDRRAWADEAAVALNLLASAIFDRLPPEGASVQLDRIAKVNLRKRSLGET